MKRLFRVILVTCLLLLTPSVTWAASETGETSSSLTYAVGSNKTFTTIASSGRSYHSGTRSYGGSSGGSTYHYGSGSSSRSRAYSTPYTGSRFGSFGGHFASFGAGFLFGSMFHPFGWGFGGGYGYGPGYPGAGGWGAPGYSPLWSLIGILVDLLVVGIVVLIVMRFFRRIRRANGFGPGAQNRSRFQQGPNAQSGGFGGFNMFGRSFNNDSYNVGGIVHGELVEQDVADACCEFVANRERCRPEAVDVELLFDDDEGFAADIRIAGRFAPRMMERDLVDAIAEFVAAREGVAPQAVEVNLEFNERLGVYARTQTRR